MTSTCYVCVFSLVVNCDLLKDTHTDGVKSTSDHVSRLGSAWITQLGSLSLTPKILQ